MLCLQETVVRTSKKNMSASMKTSHLQTTCDHTTKSKVVGVELKFGRCIQTYPDEQEKYQILASWPKLNDMQKPE